MKKSDDRFHQWNNPFFLFDIAFKMHINSVLFLMPSNN